MTSWKLKRVEREYEITDAPDLQDSTSTQRRVCRPRKVELHLIPGTILVYGATVEGQRVLRDGSLGGVVLISVGIATTSWGYSATPPQWLNKLLADDGLEWTARERNA